ncbi:iron chelate uptake ABC transporter family permease subunit [Gulosibacter chungangensis]|uniref:Iron chelate uptake ABC transporter family permease subunit n=1 Tax=Gulosibacter chungangensis TaxID=979746 RepID=A0A7J5BB44_9MICO|nr:iron chelate uptake ABC transporter family permease subunit [Gulosibacter chungangensis]
MVQNPESVSGVSSAVSIALWSKTGLSHSRTALACGACTNHVQRQVSVSLPRTLKEGFGWLNASRTTSARLSAAALLAPALKRLELGEDAAVTLGTRPTPVRLALIIVGVATTALVTAAAGPIGFIALAAPQLVRRIARTPGVSLLASAAMGAFLLASAHLVSLFIAQVYRPVPVGLITVCVGGTYLIWLLMRETHKRYGGDR